LEQLSEAEKSNNIRHKKSKANYERSIFMENDLNPKDFWRQVKKCYPIKDKKPVSKTFMIANNPVSEKKLSQMHSAATLRM
jgi:hypothetical protein